MKNLSILIVLFIFLTSCGIAPITSPKTARPLGDGKKHVTTGLSPAPTFDFGYGVNDKWDVGGGVESQLAYVFSLWNKYSFNGGADKESEGRVIYGLYSGAFGSAGAITTYGAYLGPIVSFKKGWFETYFIPKLNYVQFDSGSVDLENEDGDTVGEIEYESGNFTYVQYTLGVNFWFAETHGLNISGTTLAGQESGVAGIEYMWRM